MKSNIFRFLRGFAILIMLSVLLTACPYSSNVPIDEGSVKINPKLEGNWMLQSDEEMEFPSYFEITFDDSYHATAKKMEYSDLDESYLETVYHLTFSDVDGEVFMNAIEEEGVVYSIYKFDFIEDSEEINLTEVTEYIKETFESSSDLKKFISENKSHSFFYSNSNERYMRKL